MSDEPRRHPIYLWLVALAALGSAPFLFVGRETVWWAGLPLWLWWSLGLTTVFSLLTAWGWMHYWQCEDHD